MNPSGDKIKRPTKEEWVKSKKRAQEFSKGNFDFGGILSNTIILKEKVRELFWLDATERLIESLSAEVPQDNYYKKSGLGLLPTGEWVERNGNIILGFTNGANPATGEASTIYICPYIIQSDNIRFISIVGHEIIHWVHQENWILSSINYPNAPDHVLNEYYRAYQHSERIAHYFTYQYATSNGIDLAPAYNFKPKDGWYNYLDTYRLKPEYFAEPFLF